MDNNLPTKPAPKVTLGLRVEQELREEFFELKKTFEDLQNNKKIDVPEYARRALWKALRELREILKAA